MAFNHKQRADTPIDDSPLGKLLNNLHIATAFCTDSVLSEPWAISMPTIPHCLMFHLVLEGNAEFQFDKTACKLGIHDFILFPRGEGHHLKGKSNALFSPLASLPITCVSERYETLMYGGKGESSRLLCGALFFTHPLAQKLLSGLPTALVIRQSNRHTHTMVKQISTLIRTETQHVGMGTEAVLSRLAEILIIAVLREHLNSLEPGTLGWLSVLSDNRIAKALHLIHQSPEQHWRLGTLAKEVGMSRTNFAQQFKQLVGNTPMDYLTEWRMSLAYSRLQFGNDSLLAIALDLGYQSESALSRAFKKVIGKSPREVRRGETTR
ncbi:AraC family transcriptional regulator [Aestuariibacter sp. GS-14]|nr:AraC family transcriptional regulator [Aestuariibacter sp. GS-14]